MTWVWVMRVAWAVLPVTAGLLFADALDGRDAAFRLFVLVALWTVWTVTLAASLIPHPISLTIIRVVMPASVVAAIWAALAGGEAAETALAIVDTGLAAVLALSAAVGAAFVDGASYGNERRMPLRAPGAVLVGPLELAWALAVTGAVAGPLLLAAQIWVIGAVVTVVGMPLAALAARSLHVLSRRWIVFVPNGFVLHDPLVLREPVLFRRDLVTYLGPASADTKATDLSMQAPGLALEVRLRQPAAVVRRSETDPVATPAALFTPSRPGAVLAEAERRRLFSRQ